MPPKKKKLTKKEKQRLLEEQERIYKAQAELERQRQLKEEKERAERKRVIAEEKAKREIIEHGMRSEQLLISCSVLKDYLEQMQKLMEDHLHEDEWLAYVKCDGLPNPASFSEMNTYLYLWRGDDKFNDIDHVLVKTVEVLQLLEVMDDLITNPPLNASIYHINEWKTIRNEMRNEQQNHLDTATYRLLRNIEANMESVDIGSRKLLKKNSHFTLCLWAEIPKPVSLAKAKEPRSSLMVEFPEIGVTCTLPPSAVKDNMVIRALWLNYDHYSDFCPSFDAPPSAQRKIQKDLRETMLDEWERRRNLEAARKDKAQLTEPLRNIYDVIIAEEEENVRKEKEEMRLDTGPFQVNLRKYCVLGGVLFIDLLEKPPQPKEHRGKYTITVLDTPQALNPMPYYEHYVPPPPPEPGVRRTPEEIEIEVKKHEEALEKIAAVTVPTSSEKSKMPAEELKRELEKERELQKLVIVSVELPETVLWFEPPFAANWDPVNNYWSTEEIHDLKFNEDKQTVTFRSGRMGLMSLISYKYCNLPYQSWDLKPDLKGSNGVIFSLTASVVILEFIIREGKVCLGHLQNGSTNALQDAVGTYYKPRQLIKILQRGGVDVFPPADAFCYVEGASMKHAAAEEHLYHCMALASTGHNFAWSRWNLLAGRRNMVLQYRECVDRKKAGNYKVLHINPQKAAVVDCTEVSSSFNESVSEGTKFYADLYNLIMDQGSQQVKTKLENISFTLAETVFFMLSVTRPLCFS